MAEERERPTPSSLEASLRELIEGCETHETWLVVVRYYRGTLLDHQHLLVEFLVREAVRVVAWESKPAGYVPVAEFQQILDELGLRLVAAGRGGDA